MDGRILTPLQAIILVTTCALGVFFAIWGARSVGLLQRFEFQHYDWVLAATASEEVASDVVVVAIEDRDLREWGWPVPDEKLAEIIEALSSSGAAAIGIDIYRDNAVMAGRERLASAFASTNAVWVTKLASDGGYSIPAPDFAHSTGAVGFADIPVDADGIARRGLLLVSSESGLSLALSTQLALLASGQENVRAWQDDPSVLLFGSTPVPRLINGFGSYHDLDDAGYQVMLEYGNRSPITRTIPARDLLAGNQKTDVLRDRVAIIGVTSESIKDNFKTPLNTASGPLFSYGAQVHAALTQQLLNYSNNRSVPVSSPNQTMYLVLSLFAAALGSSFGFLSRSFLVALMLGPGLGLLLLLGGTVMMQRDLWLPVIPISLAWFAAFLGSYLAIAALSRKQKQTIERLFSDHLSPELSARIWKDRDLILAGEKSQPMRLDVSVLFADIAGSTSIGGSAPPQEFMDWASRLLNEMSRISKKYGGFVEKFTGDGILVVFGAPAPRKNHEEMESDAISACHAALQIAELVEELNTQADLLAPYRVRIGLHSGPVLSGTLGVSGALQYNIMGDTVNTASRIEAFGKRLKDRNSIATTICLSADFLKLTAGQADCEPVGVLRHDDQTREFEVFQLKSLMSLEAEK